MYSFEGNYRSQPNVSLGGRSEKSRLKKELLLKNSREARLKRQETRKRNESILIIQSCTRSYLVRKHLKLQRRNEFDELLAKEGNTLNRISHLTRLFCSFYNSNEDAKRLEHISKLLLNESRREENFISIFLLSQLLHISSKRLMEYPNDNTSLRMLDTLTRSEVITRICHDDTGGGTSNKSLVMLWKRLSCNGFFECMLSTFNQRVPTQLEYNADDTGMMKSPQHQLADSLVNILKRPIYLVGMLQQQNTNSQQVEIWMRCIMKEFIEQIIARRLSRTTYNYLYPSLTNGNEFPYDYFLHIYKQLIDDQQLIKTVYNLASFIRLIKPYFGRLQEAVICLQVVDYLITCTTTNIDDDGDSDDEEIMMMDTTSITNFDQMISNDEIRDEVMRTINSDIFIHGIVKKYMKSSQQALISITNISFHLLSHLNIRVHTCRFLYELSYSNKFLKHLWISLVNTSSSTGTSSSAGTSSTSKQNKLSTVRILLDGSTSTSPQYQQLIIRLVVFTCLFSNNLHSLHDVDFYSSIPHGGTKYQLDEVYGVVMTSQSANMFELGENIVNIITTLRDVCLHLIKILFPTQHLSPFDGVFDVREVFQRIYEGRSLPRHHHNTSSASEWNHRHCALAFKCCSRVLSHLHTRYTREHYGNDVTMWFPTHDVITDGNKSSSMTHVYQQQRSSNENENLATHMANLTDEDLRMTSSSARQLIVLTMMPYVVPFDTRVNIFTTMLRQDRQQFRTLHDHMLYDDGQQTRRPTVINITCRRNFLYEDAFNDLSLDNAPDLRKPLRVQFINQAGAEEAGYGQGVTRAFIQLLVKSAFEPRLGLFKTTDSQLYPNPHAHRLVNDSYKHFHFLGRVLGKVLYDGMRVELPFASFFLCKLLRHHNGDVDINHLRSLDPDYYRNLMFLRSCDDVTSLNLNFVVIDEHLGETRTIELVEGGQSIAVTNNNCLRYIHLLANYKLNIEIRSACDAFRDGLSSVVPLQWLRMFDHEELQTLISGAPVPIDIEDLRNNAAYSGGYTAQHPVVETFWKVLGEFTEEEKKKFLLFVTSCSRPPLLGFKEMEPAFCIHNGGDDPNRLPTSSTCLNLLRLPQYNNEENMKDKLIYCIDSGSGFELS